MASSAIKDNPCLKVIIDTGKKLYLLIVGEDSCPFLMGLATGTVVALSYDRHHKNTSKEQREAAKHNRQQALACFKKQAIDVPKKIIKMISRGMCIGIAKFKEIKRTLSAAMRRNMLKRKGLLFDSYPNITCKVTRNENGNIRAETITLPDKYVKQLLSDDEIMQALLEVEKARNAKKKKRCAFDSSPKEDDSSPKTGKQTKEKLAKLKEDLEGEDNRSQPSDNDKDSGEASSGRGKRGKKSDDKDGPDLKDGKDDESGKGSGTKSEGSGNKSEGSGNKSEGSGNKSEGSGNKSEASGNKSEEDKRSDREKQKEERKAREKSEEKKQSKSLQRTNVDGKDYLCIPEDQVKENPDEEDVVRSIRAEEAELKFERKRDLEEEEEEDDDDDD